jgi:hypothetical protein
MEAKNQNLLDWSEIFSVDDILIDELCCLEGLGELLGDLARASDIPEEPIKVADVSIGALFTVEETIKANVNKIHATMERLQGDLNEVGALEALKTLHARRSGVTTVGGAREKVPQEKGEATMGAAGLRRNRAPSKRKGRRAASPQEASMRGEAA